MKLKERKTSTKVPRKKLKTIKIKDWNEKSNIWEIANGRLNWKE